MESPSSIFEGWAAFYTLTGSSAAALTGLTFVVVTLMGDGKTARRQTGIDGIPRVSAATVAHFTAALMVSGLLCAPWPSILVPSALFAFIGIVGVSYQLRLMFQTFLLNRLSGQYRPDAEDWVWYTILPMLAYAVFFVSAITLAWAPRTAVYGPAAGVALLILCGIHNSWDIVTYITIAGSDTPEDGRN